MSLREIDCEVTDSIQLLQDVVNEDSTKDSVSRRGGKFLNNLINFPNWLEISQSSEKFKKNYALLSEVSELHSLYQY
jgi:hypothetical protein